MGDLANKVNAKLGSSSAQPSTPTLVKTFPAVPFLVTVKIPDLNYRSEPKMGDNVKGQTGKGIFTIMEVKNGWGRLKSGVGWIYLENPDYCTIGKHVEQSTPAPSTPAPATTEGLQAKDLKDLSEADVIKKVGALFTADQKQSGILASVSLAQFILESGYGKSELAQNANNCFGMKKSLSGNTWSGSTWDGKSIYTKQTKEQNPDGSYITITADFRKYPSVEKSIADHSAYLNGAMNGNKKRYEGVKGCTDYKKAVQLIKDGGYATSLTYVANLCSIIERWNLTQYDVKQTAPAEPAKPSGDELRARVVNVAKSWLGVAEPNHTDILKVYNDYVPTAVKTGTRSYKMTPSDAWCACFVSACFIKAGIPQLMGLEVSCYYMIELCKKLGIFIEDDKYVPNAKGGTVVFYDWSDGSDYASNDNRNAPDHVGLVERVYTDANGNKVMDVIEGNYSNMVKRRTLAVNGRYIRGFAEPKYGDSSVTPAPAPSEDEPVHWYRVRKSWSDSKSQVGAYKVLSNAKRKADEMGADYGVYDWNGVEVYRKAKAFTPYLVKVSIDDLNMRQGPSTDYPSNGYTGIGVFTIVAESDGKGASKWLKLKSGAGWISADYAKKL